MLKPRKSVLKYIVKQIVECRTKLRSLGEKEFAPSIHIEIIIDVESYFSFDGCKPENNKTYYSKSRKEKSILKYISQDIKKII